MVCLCSCGLQDKGFVIGLAYWPGGTAADWGNASKGLNPCSPEAGGLVRPIECLYTPAAACLTQHPVVGAPGCHVVLLQRARHAVQGNVEVAAFELKVDTIGLLQTSRQIESSLFDGASPEVLSVVAFTYAPSLLLPVR